MRSDFARILSLLALALAFAAPAEALEVPFPANPVSPPIAQTPLNPRGTVLLFPGSAWAGGTPERQQVVWDRVARLFLDQHYRVAAYDYAANPFDGLQSVKAAIRTERRGATPGPLCLYGESSGGHLALLAAEQMDGIDCVMTFGAPTNFDALARNAASHPERSSWTRVFDEIIKPLFGAPSDWAAWEPASEASALPDDVLLMTSRDDPIFPPGQSLMLEGALSYVAPPGEIPWIHGTISPEGRRVANRHMVTMLRKVARSARRAPIWPRQGSWRVRRQHVSGL